MRHWHLPVRAAATLSVALVCAFTPQAATLAETAPPSSECTQWVLTLNAPGESALDEQSQVLALKRQLHVEIIGSIPELSTYLVSVCNRATEERLATDREALGLKYAFPNVAVTPMAVTDPAYPQQWYLHNTGQSYYAVGENGVAYTNTFAHSVYPDRYPLSVAGKDIRWQEARARFPDVDGSGVTVAVIDSGLDVGLPDFAGRVSPSSATVNCDLSMSPGVLDTQGHGTRVASIIGAGEDGVGMVGVAPRATLLSIKPAGCSDSIYGGVLQYGWAAVYASSRAQVLNFSNGININSFRDYVGPGQVTPLYLQALAFYKTQAIDVAFDTGAIIVASSGNGGDGGEVELGFQPGDPLFPASFAHVVSVGATGSDGLIAPYSQWNNMVDISAPGTKTIGLVSNSVFDCGAVGSYSCFIDLDGTSGPLSRYSVQNGTSFSAPIVSGAAALAKQKWPRLTSDGFEILVRQTADDAGPAGYDARYGAGTLNLERLLSYNYPPITASARLQFTPPSVTNSGADATQLAAQFVNLEGAGDMTTVEADFSPVGLSAHLGMALQQDDAGILSYATPPVAIPSSVAPGSYPISVRLTDAGGFSGTASASLTVTPSSQTPGQLVVSLPTGMETLAGTEVTVPVFVSKLQGLDAFGFSVLYDPAKLSFSRTLPTADAAGIAETTGQVDAPNGMKDLIYAGTLPTALASPNGGVVAALVFTVGSNASGTATLELRNPTDDFVGAQLSSGALTIGGTGITTPIVPPPSVAPVVGPATTPLAVAISGPHRGEDFSTKKKTVTLSGTLSADVATVVVKSQEQAIAPGTTAWTATVPLNEGENAIPVVAWDVAKARQATTSVTITRDTEAPDAVEDLKATPDGVKTRLTWKAPEDGIVGYHIYRVIGDDFDEIDVTRSRSFLTDGAGPFAVTAEDKAGNESDPADSPQVFGGRDTGFSDVPATHFASVAVATLRERGIVEGRDGSFIPDAFVTRAEFAKMLAGVRGVNIDATTTTFRDVSKRSPLVGFVAAVVGQGWARGEGVYFYPNRPVSRMEAARMIVSAAGLPPSGDGGYTDVAPGEEMGFAAALKTAGIASGQNGLFMPNRPLTRAEAAKMLVGVIATSA